MGDEGEDQMGWGGWHCLSDGSFLLDPMSGVGGGSGMLGLLRKDLRRILERLLRCERYADCRDGGKLAPTLVGMWMLGFESQSSMMSRRAVAYSEFLLCWS